ncbi:MAG: DNRLRE domain-containing protein [Caldilineaceae bacterium]
MSQAKSPTQSTTQEQSPQNIDRLTESKTVTPSIDASVKSTDPSTNFGTSPELHLAVDSQNQSRSNILLYFPVAPEEGGTVPYQAIINKATLKLSLQGGTQVATTISARSNITDWAGTTDKALWESSVTFNNRPNFTDTIAGSASITPGDHLSMDITALYAGWLNDPGNNFNYGITLRGNTEASPYDYVFSSREGVASPVIEVEYTPQPSTISIKKTVGPVTVDNVCSPTEYPDDGYRFVDVNLTYNHVYVAHDDEFVYFCAENVISDYANRFYALYFDTDNGKEIAAGRTDLAFYTNPISGKADNAWGNSNDKFTLIPCYITPPPESCDGNTTVKLANWEAKSGKVTSPSPMEVAEYKVKLDLIGVNCQQRKLGLAYYHHWVTYDADDYGWPTDRTFNSPKTWIEASFDQLPTSLPTECQPVLPFQTHDVYLPLVSG